MPTVSHTPDVYSCSDRNGEEWEGRFLVLRLNRQQLLCVVEFLHFGSSSWEHSKDVHPDLSIRTRSRERGVVVSQRSVPVKCNVHLSVKTVGIQPLPWKRLNSSFICMFTSVVSVHSVAITKSLQVQ